MSSDTVVPRQYFGAACRSLPSRNANPFDDVQRTAHTYRYSCAYSGCMNVETSKPFPRCSKCLTRYCSKECQVLDWKVGQHKEKCQRYNEVKTHIESVLCKPCLKVRLASLIDPNVTYQPCHKCHRKELILDTHFDDVLVSDPDIHRVWFQ